MLRSKAIYVEQNEKNIALLSKLEKKIAEQNCTQINSK